MSGPSTYQPQNAFLKWFEKRLPIGGLIHSSFVVYPTPRNLNYWWTFGGILSFMLGVQIITGIVLAMHYTPHVALAFKSVESILRDVNSGIPGVGEAIVTCLWGCYAVGNPTLNRFYSLHYQQPNVFAGVVVLHVW